MKIVRSKHNKATFDGQIHGSIYVEYNVNQYCYAEELPYIRNIPYGTRELSPRKFFKLTKGRSFARVGLLNPFLSDSPFNKFFGKHY